MNANEREWFALLLDRPSAMNLGRGSVARPRSLEERPAASPYLTRGPWIRPYSYRPVTAMKLPAQPFRLRPASYGDAAPSPSDGGRGEVIHGSQRMRSVRDRTT
jgi:hypothetical protein